MSVPAANSGAPAAYAVVAVSPAGASSGIVPAVAAASTPLQPASEKREATLKAWERRLWWWNFGCGMLHLVQAVAALTAAQKVDRIAKFKLPLTTLFLNWAPVTPGGPDLPQQSLKTVALLPFAATTSGFAWMSAAAHFTVLFCFKTYMRDLQRGMNRFRWYEYAFSSSLMMGLIAMLFGMYDVISLVLVMSVNATMNLFGDSHELDNAGKAGKAGAVRWINFWYGCFAGIVPWACVFAYVGGVGGGSTIPGFVWAILFVYLVLFLTFPINMWLQYKGVGWWSNARWADSGIDNGGYFFGEKVYQVLSLVAKSLLLWLVIGGSNQPNAYTQ